MKHFFIILAVFHFTPTYGCIWQAENKNGSPVFWDSNSIPVCFAPPQPQPMSGGVSNPMDEEYLQKYSLFMETIRKTLTSQINGRTGIKLNGFGYCEPQSQKTLAPKIRIDLNGTEGLGALAASIGPSSSRNRVNISMSSTDQDWVGGVKPKSKSEAGQRVRVFNDTKDISYVSLHETMHLLGFHHAGFWNADLSKDFPDCKSAVQVGDQIDTESVMNHNRKYDSQGIAQLSAMDVNCLNKLADRTIAELPRRDAVTGLILRESLTQPLQRETHTENIK